MCRKRKKWNMKKKASAGNKCSKMKTKDWIYLALLLILSFLPIAVLPWSERAALSPGSSFLFYYPLYQWGLLPAGGFVLWRFVKAVDNKAGNRALLWLVPVLIWFVSTFVGFRMSRESRMEGMAEFASRSQTLIAAIKEFEQDQGQPPTALTNLVPAYLPEVPETGMPAYPEYVYYSGDESREWYANNSWVLIVNTPSVFLNWDQMFYFPRQNYADVPFNAGVERVGDWAYNHE